MNAVYRLIRSCCRSIQQFRFGKLKRDRRRNGNGAYSIFLRPGGTVRLEAGRDFSDMTLQERIYELQKAAEQPKEVFFETLRDLASAGDSRDPNTRGHSERVTRFSVEISKIMGLPDDAIERIRIGALIHDVGKITIDKSILNKPSALTHAEYEVMKTHTTRGYEMFRHIPQLEDITPGIRYHHERLDGKGYPYGLKGDAIPRLARIITVADCFDAMTTVRAYQDSLPIEYVLGMIRSAAGIRFDEDAVKALIQGVRSGRILTRLEDRIPAKSLVNQ